MPSRSNELPPIFVGFWSMKGGVGRSFLLANFAAYLAEMNQKVVTMDLDTEAPTLEYVFGVGREQRIGFEPPAVHGLHFLAPGVRHGGMDPTVERVESALVDVYETIENYPLDPSRTLLEPVEQEQITQSVRAQRKLHQDGGPIWLLPARYEPNILSKLVYTDQTVVQHLSTTLLRVAQRKGVRYILLDMRSGISDAAAWWLDELDAVVIVTTASTQSMSGTIDGIRDFVGSRTWRASPHPVINRVPPGVPRGSPPIKKFRQDLDDLRPFTTRRPGFEVPVLSAIEELGVKDALMWLVQGKAREGLGGAFKGLCDLLSTHG